MTYIYQSSSTHKQILPAKLFLQIDDIISKKENTFIILKLVNLDPQNYIMGGRKSVLYIIKKDVNYPGILQKRVISQEIDSRSDLVNI